MARIYIKVDGNLVPILLGSVLDSEMNEIEVTIHTSNFEWVRIYVGDGTLDEHGNPVYAGPDTLVYTSNGDETVTLMVEEGRYITTNFKSIYNFDANFYYTSLDSTGISMDWPTWGGNIHITEPMEIYYNSVDDD